jgi:hypothetical protein
MIKMPKLKNVDSYMWGSHRPIIKAIMEYYNPTGVMELGCGIYSTKAFSKYKIPIISFEEDDDWAMFMRNQIENKRLKIIHLDLRKYNISVGTPYKQIKNEIIDECVEFYYTLYDPSLELLFIDNVVGLRSRILTKMYEKFKYIIFHDTEDKAYKYVIPQSPNYKYIDCNYLIPHTGVLIRKDCLKSFDEIQNLIIKYCDIYKIDRTVFINK